MDLRLPRTGVIFLVLMLAFTVGLTAWLLPRLGGPGLHVSKTYDVHANFPDVQQLETKAQVLSRGVAVGTVEHIDVRGDVADVTLNIEARYRPLYRDATARIGQRTAIGDAYVDITLGSPRAGRFPSGDRITRIRPTVEFDEAFDTFDPVTRGHAAALTRTFGDGAADPRTAGRWNATVANLSAAVHEVNGLTQTLRGQRSTLASLVSNSRTALAELGTRERALRSIVAGGDRTFAAFAANPKGVSATLTALPRFLQQARATLATARPLLKNARPVLSDLSASAPALASTFTSLRPASRDLKATLDGLRTLNRVAVPTLKRAERVMTIATPFANNALPVLANLVPIMRFLTDHQREFASWFSFTRAFSSQGDSKSKWARFLIFAEPQVALGIKGSVEHNAYPQPGDQAHNEAYRPGSYTRLMPFVPGGPVTRHKARP
jgi:phospholipid/cholesterol/gamma-HCH transport system substrate-binding protein